MARTQPEPVTAIRGYNWDGQRWVPSPEQQQREARVMRIYGNVVRCGLLAVWVTLGLMAHWR